MEEVLSRPSGLKQLGFGGGCHWCTEAVFDHLIGVSDVKQGWIKSKPPYEAFSEAVLVSYDSESISTETLIHIHLLTHASDADHSMRAKYRSAIYYLNKEEQKNLQSILDRARSTDSRNYVTKVLPMATFQSNNEKYLNYYRKRPEAPFCKTHITPKLQKLMKKFGNRVRPID
ncbi:MAG: peptide-methionine (S)-S-oxide reductase [Ekhidna sp.]|nr:peptide-methionine (S)-S-oxide reductase [Ekhidna sp.]